MPRMNFKIPRGREPFNGWSHLLATFLAVFGSGILIESAGQRDAMFYAKIFYSMAMIFAFGSSAVFHLAVTTPEKLRILRNIDHLGILTLIIGTYAPLSIAFFPNHWNILLITSLSLLLFSGLYLVRLKNRLLVSLCYIFIAGLPIVFVPLLWEDHQSAILWFLCGSLIYLIGGFCYTVKFPKRTLIRFHEVWHICAILGSITHFLLIYRLP